MALLSGNDLSVRISTKSDTGGVDDTRNRLNQLENTATNVSSRTSGMTAAFFKAGLALEAVKFAADLAAKSVGKVWDFAKDAIQTASAYEQSAIAFEVMLGSADKARKMLKDVSRFAATTPFDLPELVDTTKRLLAYNIEAEKIIPTLTSLGNITAGIGREKMPQLILAYGQVRAATKLTGAELRQFSEAGVPLLDALAKQFNVTEAAILEMVSKGKVGFADVEKAIASMSGEGGKFYGLMERQSKTFDGTISNLRDNFTQMAMEIVGISNDGTIREGSVFQTLSAKAQDLLKWVDENQKALEEWGRALMDGLVNVLEKHVFPKLEQFADWLTNPKYADERQKWIDKMSDLARNMGLVAKGGETIIGWVSKAIGWFDKLYNKIEPVLGLLGKLSGAIPGVKQFNQVTSLLDKAGQLKIPGFANGTNNAPGGLALVGERGPELVNLPRGSQVTPAPRTKEILSNRAGVVIENFNMTVQDTVDWTLGLAKLDQTIAARLG